MDAVEDPARRAIAEGVLDDFEAKVIPMAARFKGGATHNDANEQNVIVRLETSGECAGPFRATPVGIIDFGDINVSWRVNDVAITCAYYMLNKEDPVGDAALPVSQRDSNQGFRSPTWNGRSFPRSWPRGLVVSCVLGAYSAAGPLRLGVPAHDAEARVGGARGAESSGGEEIFTVASRLETNSKRDGPLAAEMRRADSRSRYPEE